MAVTGSKITNPICVDDQGFHSLEALIRFFIDLSAIRPSNACRAANGKHMGDAEQALATATRDHQLRDKSPAPEIFSREVGLPRLLSLT